MAEHAVHLQKTSTRSLFPLSPTLVTIPIVLVKSVLGGVSSRGEACYPYLADAGIAPELLDQPAARVTADQYAALMRSLMERLGDEALGFLSRRLKHGTFLLMVRAALGAPDLEHAIRRVAHTFELVQDDVSLELVRDRDLAGVALRFTEPDTRPAFLDELLMRVFWRLFAWLTGGRLPAARFDFAFACPPYVASYARAFPAALNFEREQSAFWFDAAQLRAPIRQNEATLRMFIAGMPANILVPRRGPRTTGARVLAHLQETVPGWPDLVATADALHMSSSTLQRRLAAEGTSFQALKDELRRDMAIVRLATGTVPVTDLALELGFSDSAVFQRAFKSWTGCTPGQYRRP